MTSLLVRATASAASRLCPLGAVAAPSVWARGSPCVAAAASMSSKTDESDAEFDARYEAYFNREDIDGWEIRKAMQDLNCMDMVPEPAIVAAALRACRRVNDYALTTRILEVVKIKTCGKKDVWAYMMQELRPTLDELGVSTPAQLGYDKPELWLPNPYNVHG